MPLDQMCSVIILICFSIIFTGDSFGRQRWTPLSYRPREVQRRRGRTDLVGGDRGHQRCHGHPHLCRYRRSDRSQAQVVAS